MINLRGLGQRIKYVLGLAEGEYVRAFCYDREDDRYYALTSANLVHCVPLGLEQVSLHAYEAESWRFRCVLDAIGSSIYAGRSLGRLMWGRR